MVVATIGNTLGSLVAYAIGAYGGRPFLERYGRYLLIRQHEIDLADRFFERWGRITVFVSRLLPVVRTFISFPAGVVRMPLRPFIIYSTAGAFLWSILLVWVGEQLGANWVEIRADAAALRHAHDRARHPRGRAVPVVAHRDARAARRRRQAGRRMRRRLRPRRSPDEPPKG